MNKVKIKINDKKKEDEFDMELEMNIEKQNNAKRLNMPKIDEKVKKTYIYFIFKERGVK